MRRPKRIEMLVTKARIPGIFPDGEDDLVHSRDVDDVKTHRSRAARMLGARTFSQRAHDDQIRNFGIPIFNREAGQAQLAELLHRGRNQK